MPHRSASIPRAPTIQYRSGMIPWHGDRPECAGDSEAVDVSRSAVDVSRNVVPNRAFRDACIEHGIPESADLNDPDATGVSRLAMTVHRYRRVSAHDAFLDPVVDRPNLTVRSGALVDSIILKGSRATGIAAVVDGTPERISADNIILAAGAVQSPSILLRSGVGLVDAMTPAGVDQRHRLDWVGRNLAEHPMVIALLPLVEQAQTTGTDARQGSFLARPGGGSAGDRWHLSCLSLTPLGGMLASPVVTLMSSVSRGTVTLAPDGRSHMEVNALSAQADVDQLWEGFELLLDVVNAPALRAIAAAPVMATTGPIDLDDARAHRAEFLHAHLMPYRHLAGTCRMSDDPHDGVVDSDHRVHGIDNLRVIDASVLPDATSSNLNLTVVALADRAASQILDL